MSGVKLQRRKLNVLDVLLVKTFLGAGRGLSKMFSSRIGMKIEQLSKLDPVTV
jgi:hypothetical protein